MSSLSPKASFITVAFNRPGYLLEVIRSLQAQTNPDWEHLIYNNGSTNSDVARIMTEEANKDHRIRCWHGSTNINSPAKFWNFLLDRIRGCYVGIVDDDNHKDPRHLEVMGGVLDSNNLIDAVTCGMRVMDMHGKVYTNHWAINKSTDVIIIRDHNTIDSLAILYRREALERCGYFAEDINTGEDWDMAIRSVLMLAMIHLDEVLADYRCHDGSRSYVAKARLGEIEDTKKIRSRVRKSKLGVKIIQPDINRLTASQRDVCDAMRAGVEGISWVESGIDLLVIISPFQLTSDECCKEVNGFSRVLTIHMEDPYALEANLERVRSLTSVCETWVCTNDTSTISYYQKVVGNRIVVCPSLSVDHRIAFPTHNENSYDIGIVGYAYPSRIPSVQKLVHALGNKFRIAIVGDGWDKYDIPCISGTVDPIVTMNFYSQCRSIVCLHRVHGDCSDGPVGPRLVQRGYIEAYSGARVFIDQNRSDHAFEDNEVVWFNSIDELISKLGAYLSGPDDIEACQMGQLRALRDFTHRSRLSRVLNCVRSPRYFAVIP